MFLQVQNMNITDKPVWGALEYAYASPLGMSQCGNKILRMHFFYIVD